MQIRISHAAAIPNPPPKQNPRIFAMIGFEHASGACIAPDTASSYCSWACCEARNSLNCEMSAPEIKAFSPSPATTITRTSGSASNASMATGTSAHICTVIAFILVGLENVMYPTEPFFSTISSAMKTP